MNPLQDVKHLVVIAPVAIKDNASWTTIEIDRAGFDYAVIGFILGATDIAMAALKVQESATSGSGFTDVTGLIFGTSTNVAGSTSSLPSATADGLIFLFEIDLRNRKRYLDLVATAGDGTAGSYAAAYCILSKAKAGITTTALAGASQTLRV